jgi:putative peptidoglycan lipid II flippase
MRKIIKSVGLTMIATVLARLFGFLREMLIAYKFGTSVLSDSFIVAFSIPDLLVNGIGTAIATMYIPLFFQIENNEERLKEFNFSVKYLLLILAGVIVVAFNLFPSVLIRLFVSGFDAETTQLTIRLTRSIIWSTIPIVLAYFYKAYAQIRKQFALATLLGCIVNVTVIVSILYSSSTKYMILAYGTVLGNLLYAIMLYVLAAKKGYKQKFTKNILNSDTKKLCVNILPICFSNLIYEINQIIDKNFASSLDTGTISALNYSSKIINLITAIIGTSIASFFFPRITKIHNSNDELKEAEELMKINQYMLIVLFPIVIFVFFMSTDIIKILFARGSFGEQSMILTKECLMFYSLGIIGFNLKSIWIRTYNARMDTKTPAFNSVIAVILNLTLNIVLIGYLRHMGLALATSVSSLVTDFLLIRSYSRINANFKLQKFMNEFLKILFSSLVFVPFLMLVSRIGYYNLPRGAVSLGILLIATLIYLGILIMCNVSGMRQSIVSKKQDRSF